MKPKIIAGLYFIVAIALLALIASGYSSGEVRGVSTRTLLVILLVVVASMFTRHWRSREKASGAGAGLGSPGRLKVFYLGLAALSACSYFFIRGAVWSDISVAVAMFLTGAFVGREKDQDERVEHLKLRAVLAALFGAFWVVFGGSWVAAQWHHEKFSSHTFSAFDMMIFAMLIALGLFHYWRWQDGRAEPAS